MPDVHVRPPAAGLWPEINRRGRLFHIYTLTEQLKEAKGKELKIVACIDDLDRCLPEKAVELLEGAKVKVTYDNEGLVVKTSRKPYRVQVIQADENGVFTYAMPRAGQWGFLALTEDGKKVKSPDNKMKPVITKCLICVKIEDMK